MGKGEGVIGLAFGLRSTSTVVGMYIQHLGASGTGYAGTVPISGKVRLDWIQMRTRAFANFKDPSLFQLAVASDVPTAQAHVLAAEQVFPFVSTLPGHESRMSMFFGPSEGLMPVGLVVPMNGRRFVCSVKNMHTAAASFHVFLGIHGVVGGEARARVDFLSGDWLEER